MESFLKEAGQIASDENSYDLETTKRCFEIFSERYKPWVNDAAASIAHLTAVDGATILNTSFEVLGFGVKIKTRQTPRNAEKVSVISPLEADGPNDQVSLGQEFRGMRHLSAARFVELNPSSEALVVSQDGGITGFVMRKSDEPNTSSELRAYRGLELLL
jgi:hypothetical protein